MAVLQITHLQKSFKNKTVLSDVNLLVPAHSIYGFVGKNGAGETTTMKIILGLLKADRGEVKIDSETVVYGQNKTNQWIGYVPDVPEFYTFITAHEYMQLCGEVLDMDRDAINQRSEVLLAKVGLDQEERRLKGFSRGMKQRLGIAQALLGNPKLLICDEPISALDPVGRKEILDILYAVSDQTTILFSTHILSDVERICSDVAFLNHGEVVKQGSIADLKQSSAYHVMMIEAKSIKDTERILRASPTAEKQHHMCVRITGTSDDIRLVNDYIAKHQIAIEKIEWLEPTLEDLFVEVESEWLHFSLFSRRNWWTAIETVSSLFGMLFALLGVISPVTVRLMPWLIDKLGDIAAENGVDVAHITLNAATVWAHFFSNICLSLLVFIFVYSELFTKEYHAHTLILIFTHGIVHFKVVLAKCAWMVLIWTVGYWLAAAVTYIGSVYYWNNSIVHHLLLANVLWWLFEIWIISLIVLLSTISHSYIGVLVSALGILFGISVLSPWLDIASYLPTQLSSSGALLSGVQGIVSYSYSLISTLISSFVFLGLSILIMNRKEI